MSHSIQVLYGGIEVYARVTIQNYAVGGEAVSGSEVSLAPVDAIFMSTVPASQNSLGVPLLPVLNAGKIVLFRFVSGAPTEIPNTNGLNATVTVLVHSSAN